MEVVEFGRVLHIHLEDMAGHALGIDSRDVQGVDPVLVEPPEVGDGQKFGHHCSVEVVAVNVQYVGGRPVGVVTPPRIPLSMHKEVHVRVCEHFQLHLGHLQHGVLAEARRGVVMRRI